MDETSISNGRGMGDDDGGICGDEVGCRDVGSNDEVGTNVTGFKVGNGVGRLVRWGFFVGCFVIRGVGSNDGEDVGGARFAQPVNPKHVCPAMEHSESDPVGQGVEHDWEADIQFVPQ